MISKRHSHAARANAAHINKVKRARTCTAEVAAEIHAASDGRLTVNWDDWRMQGGARYYRYDCTCGDRFYGRTRDARKGLVACPTCSKGRSNGEREVEAWLRSIGINPIVGDRVIVAPYELDLVVPEHRLAIEYHGLYWHRNKAKSLHADKCILAAQAGYRLIQIYEDEWTDRQDAVKAILLSALGRSERSGARHYAVTPVESAEARAFLEVHHIQGAGVAPIAYGLRDRDGKLRAVMTFSRPSSRRKASSDGVYELTRFAADHNIAGAASRLWAAFRRDYDPVGVVTYADHRYFKGGVYAVLGFAAQSTTTDYEVVLSGKRLHKAGFKKSRFKAKFPEVYAAYSTEAEMTEAIGGFRIYNAGRTTYLWGSLGEGQAPRPAPDVILIDPAEVAERHRQRKLGTSAKLTAALKRRWTPEARADAAKARKEAVTPAFRRKVGQASKQVWEREGHAEKMHAIRQATGVYTKAAEGRTRAARAKYQTKWFHPEHGVKVAWAGDMAAEYGGTIGSWNGVRSGHTKTCKGWSLG